MARRSHSRGTPRSDEGDVWDWSPDGESVLVARWNKLSKVELWSLPLAAAPDAYLAARKVISEPDFDIFQGHYSPDGKWIAFNATALQSEGETSTMFVTRTTGGPWVRMTDSKHWDDKPRWSPDGKTPQLGRLPCWYASPNPSTPSAGQMQSLWGADSESYPGRSYSPRAGAL